MVAEEGRRLALLSKGSATGEIKIWSSNKSGIASLHKGSRSLGIELPFPDKQLSHMKSDEANNSFDFVIWQLED